MDALWTVRAFCRAWISLGVVLCSLASAQVAKMEEEEQREKLRRAFFECYRRVLTQPPVLTGLYCNRTWDRVMCWPDTAAGTVGYQPCPAYINGFDQAEYATKQCLENGTWYVDPARGSAWTNYTACMTSVNREDLPPLIVEHMPGIKLMYTIGYTLSLMALVLAVTIMACFRRLHCPRNLIHLNMFLAFLGRAAFSLMKTVLMVNDLGFPNDVNNTGGKIEFIKEGTHWECKLFFTLFYYILLASVMWLFNEGLYLVLILSVSVFVEKTKVRWFVLLGWGLPVVFVVAWVVCRIHLDDMLCWNVHVHDKLFWILNGPMVASVAVNFAFFIVIMRMLFTKLTASNCPESRRVRYRKLAKSTLILIPLFAVYYMGFIWLPDHISPASDLFKLYVEMLFNSFQGFLVALLFCFLNAEVQNEIKKKWQRRTDSAWRSQTSLGTFLRRSVLKDDRQQHRGHNHSRSFLDSASTHSVGLQLSSPAKVNGHLSPISEETAPLNDSSTHQETSVPPHQKCDECLQHDVTGVVSDVSGATRDEVDSSPGVAADLAGDDEQACEGELARLCGNTHDCGDSQCLPGKADGCDEDKCGSDVAYKLFNGQESSDDIDEDGQVLNQVFTGEKCSGNVTQPRDSNEHNGDYGRFCNGENSNDDDVRHLSGNVSDVDEWKRKNDVTVTCIGERRVSDTVTLGEEESYSGKQG